MAIFYIVFFFLLLFRVDYTEYAVFITYSCCGVVVSSLTRVKLGSLAGKSKPASLNTVHTVHNCQKAETLDRRANGVRRAGPSGRLKVLEQEPFSTSNDSSQ